MARRRVLVAMLLGVAAAQEQATLVRGRVTSGEDGRPLVAVVTVRDWYDVVGERGVDVDEKAPAAVIEAAADGAYEVPAKGLHGPVLTVSAKGHASVTWREDVAAASGARRDVVLPVAGTIAGRVVGPDGAPAAGARVFAVEWDALDREENPDPLAAAADLLWGSGQYDDGIAHRYVAAAAGRDGKFRIEDADAAKRYAVVAASPDLGPSMLEGPLLPGAPMKDLRLAATALVRVRVVTEKDAPVAVTNMELPGSPRRIAWSEAGDGLYEVGPVGPGAHVIVMKSRSHGEIRHGFTLPRAARRLLTRVLVPDGDEVSGVVSDTEGLPVAGARVNVQAWDPDAGKLRSANIFTDEEGRFVVGGQPMGEVRIYVIARGYQLAHILTKARRLDVRLRRARAVTLEVSPPKGVERRDSLMVAARTLEDGGGPWIRGTAAWGETVTIDGVPLGRAAIRIWTPGAALLEREVVIEAGEKPLALDPARLERAPAVTVRLVDEEGFPIPGLKVHAEIRDLPPVKWEMTEKTTDAEGLAVLELHADGAVTVYIEEGSGRQRERRTIELPGDPATVVDVRAGPRKE